MADKKSELREIKIAGAKAHKNSGRGMVKADASNDMFVIDIKEAAKSFTLNKEVWRKICTDAYKVDPYKHPQLLIVLGTDNKQRLAIIEYSVLEELMEYKWRYEALQ